MDIAFIITSRGWGGLEMNTLKLAKLLSGKGYRISLITQENSTIYQKRENLFVSCILINKKRKYFDFKSAKTISKSLKIRNISSLIVFDNTDLDVISWTKKLFYPKLKVIYQQHMQFGKRKKKDFIHTLRFRSINYWISPLQYLKNQVLEKTKIPQEKIKIIPLCLDIELFTNKKYTKQEAQQKLNISAKAPLIGIIGRVSEKKGQLFIIEALMQLKKENIDTELLIFGSPTVNDVESKSYYKLIQETVKQNGMEEQVHFVAYQKDVSAFYHAVDVFVLASQSETYGMVTIEAMLSKIPIIATQSGGTSEILDYGKLGLLYEYEDITAFNEKLIWLLNNKRKAENMALDAQENAVKKYAQEIEINEIDKLLKSI